MTGDPRYMQFGYRLRFTGRAGGVLEAPYPVVTRSDRAYRISNLTSVPLSLIARVEIINQNDTVIDSEPI